MKSTNVAFKSSEDISFTSEIWWNKRVIKHVQLDPTNTYVYKNNAASEKVSSTSQWKCASSTAAVWISCVLLLCMNWHIGVLVQLLQDQTNKGKSEHLIATRQFCFVCDDSTCLLEVQHECLKNRETYENSLGLSFAWWQSALSRHNFTLYVLFVFKKNTFIFSIFHLFDIEVVHSFLREDEDVLSDIVNSMAGARAPTGIVLA